MAIYSAFICDNYGNAAPVFGVVPGAADLRNVDLLLYTKPLYRTGHGSDDSWNSTTFNTNYAHGLRAGVHHSPDRGDGASATAAVVGAERGDADVRGDGVAGAVRASGVGGGGL